jgi:ASC-1-like (ASCH) protein
VLSAIAEAQVQCEKRVSATQLKKMKRGEVVGFNSLPSIGAQLFFWALKKREIYHCVYKEAIFFV